jgi:hypothetical protein
MTTDPRKIDGGDALAATVRALAHDAYHVLSGRPVGGDPREVPAVLGRIAGLRRELRGGATEDLRKWLDSLQIRVEGVRDGARPSPLSA